MQQSRNGNVPLRAWKSQISNFESHRSRTIYPYKKIVRSDCVFLCVSEFGSEWELEMSESLRQKIVPWTIRGRGG